MYYVECELEHCVRGVIHMGTSSTDDFDKAVEQFSAFREVAELLLHSDLIESYELYLGMYPKCEF